MRLGVTGLSRSGKTVFITALVRNLIAGGRLPFFEPEAEGRIVRAYLEPQPDDDLPRFDYEAHMSALIDTPPAWPESTRRISELRVTIEYATNQRLKRAVGLAKVHLDIVDYPGEWLIDLPLLDQDYAAFSREALSLATEREREAHSKAWRIFLAKVDPAAREDENIAIEGARLYTDYLKSVRASGAQATLAPGRFLLPGDLAGSPLVTFFPMDSTTAASSAAGSLRAMMERRFESYKSQVVRPFFTGHFKRLDRQIVLVDVLGALDKGASALSDLERAMTGIMRALRPRPQNWLSQILGKRLDKVLFAATKADHLPASSHDRLAAILKKMTETAVTSAETSGVGVEAIALSALRATRESKVVEDGQTFPCLTGIPLPGEKLGATIFEGTSEASLFPGDLPDNPDDALDKARTSKPGSLSLVRFRPPILPKDGFGGSMAALPHIRLDRALQFLAADYLK